MNKVHKATKKSHAAIKKGNLLFKEKIFILPL